jgi:hypothetical protein
MKHAPITPALRPLSEVPVVERLEIRRKWAEGASRRALRAAPGKERRHANP